MTLSHFDSLKFIYLSIKISIMQKQFPYPSPKLSFYFPHGESLALIGFNHNKLWFVEPSFHYLFCLRINFLFQLLEIQFIFLFLRARADNRLHFVRGIGFVLVSFRCLPIAVTTYSRFHFSFPKVQLLVYLFALVSF